MRKKSIGNIKEREKLNKNMKKEKQTAEKCELFVLSLSKQASYHRSKRMKVQCI